MGQSRVSGPGYRGDLLVRPGTCVSRYGTLADGGTHRPVAGASVAIGGPGVNGGTVSGLDGWYRIDWVGFNTTVLRVSHPDYIDPFRIVSRGVGGVTRLDVDLERR
jgi:hypothetical protein